MAGSITTVDGDVVDAVALGAYGYTSGATEAVMDANPQITGLGPVLPAGIVLALPDLEGPPAAPIVMLWD